ncbi:MAG: DUF2256 domain-containing protein [Betaproteobacteria bacterium]
MKPSGKNGRGAGQDFKGNKSFLPSKPCLSCGLSMSWRKRWAKNWDEVRYCSEACRRAGPKDKSTAGAQP